MKKFVLAAVLLLGFAVSAGAAGDHATPDEAKAMAIKAAAYLKANGEEKAFAAFKDPAGGFRDRDLYVVVQGLDGTMKFHPILPAMIGKSLIDLRDVDGKLFVHDIVAIKDAGWVEFKWQDPVSKSVAPKKSYFIRVGDDLVGVGAYAK